MEVNLSPGFKRAYKKMTQQIREDFQEKITIFCKNPRHPSLKTHKLKGYLQECFAFRLKNGYRVLFEFKKPNTVNMPDIGPHDLYKKR